MIKKSILLLSLFLCIACKEPVAEYLSMSVYARLVDKDGNSIMNNPEIYDLAFYSDADKKEFIRTLPKTQDGSFNVGPELDDLDENLNGGVYLFCRNKKVAQIRWVVEKKYGGTICTKIYVNGQEYLLENIKGLLDIQME